MVFSAETMRSGQAGFSVSSFPDLAMLTKLEPLLPKAKLIKLMIPPDNLSEMMQKLWLNPPNKLLKREELGGVTLEDVRVGLFAANARISDAKFSIYEGTVREKNNLRIKIGKVNIRKGQTTYRSGLIKAHFQSIYNSENVQRMLEATEIPSEMVKIVVRSISEGTLSEVNREVRRVAFNLQYLDGDEGNRQIELRSEMEPLLEGMKNNDMEFLKLFKGVVGLLDSIHSNERQE